MIFPSGAVAAPFSGILITIQRVTMRLTIFAKIAIMLVLSIIAVVVPLIWSVLGTVDTVLTNESKVGIGYKSMTVTSMLQGMHDSVESVLWQSSRRSDLIDAVAARDEKALAAVVRDMDAHSSIDFVTITDNKGIVLFRGHSGRKGDSLANGIFIKGPLEGQPLVLGVDSGNEVAFSVRGGAPLVRDGKVVGVISAGVRLDTMAAAESLHALLGAEVTFFKGRLRVSTSLKDANGKPMVGTELNNPEVVRNVLERGEVFTAQGVVLGGISYDVLYHPLKNTNGAIIGMFFLGTPTTALAAIKGDVVRGTLVVGGLLALLMAVIGIVAARMIITKPMARVTNVIRDLVDDKAELSYRFDTSKKDEVAQLAHQVNRLTGKVEAMLCNIEGYKNLMNAIPEPVFAVDDDYKVSLVNERVCALANVADPTLLYGRHINDILKTDIYGSDKCPLKEVMRTRARSVSDVFPLKIDGKERLIRGLSDVIKDCHGNDAGFFQVASDVTDMVEQERKLEKQMERIAEVNRKVTGIAARVNTSAETIQVQTGTIQSSAVQQSRVMSDTLHAIQQMNETVMEIARSAGTASSSAEAGRKRAAEGETIVNSAMGAIDSVRALAEALHTSLEQLGGQAENIGAVMNVISDIADQTNLLALNAAIEAARAGDAGRGFAVVADEVRKLAEKTMVATQEVRKATGDIQSGAHQNISNMAQVAQAVENATELSRKSGLALSEIVSLVSDSSSQISAIAAAAEEQSSSSEEIARSVNEVTGIAEDTAQKATESARTVDELASLARELHTTVS